MRNRETSLRHSKELRFGGEHIVSDVVQYTITRGMSTTQNGAKRSIAFAPLHYSPSLLVIRIFPRSVIGHVDDFFNLWYAFFDHAHYAVSERHARHTATLTATA